MHVSFGSIVENCKTYKTSNQLHVDNIINNYFEKNDPRYGRSGYGKDKVCLCNFEEDKLSNYIENNMGADVYITYKKNGDIEMKLKESEYQKEDLGKNRWIKPEDRISLILKAKLSYDIIESKIAEFAEKCAEIASKYNLEDLFFL